MRPVRRSAALGLAMLAGIPVLAAAAMAAEPVLLDDFDDLTGWTTIAAPGASVWLTEEPGPNGPCMRIGFELDAGGGWVIVRKTFSFPLPANYAFTFRVRGEAPPNHFEFKLVDPRGRNVWWRQQRDFVFPSEWQRETIRRSRLEFAWGAHPSRELRHVGAIEFAIAAGEGGRGSVWLDELTLEPREPARPDGLTPAVSAATFLPGHEPERMLDGDPATLWRGEPGVEGQWVLVDLGRNCEYGGLVIDWDAEDFARAYDVQVSNDGAAWERAYTTTTAHGGRDYVYLPDSESRFVRLDLHASSRQQGYAIAALAVKPFEFSASPNRFFAAIAGDAPPGAYPKYLMGRQTYWTVVGVNGDEKEAIVNEEGAIEVDRGGFSLEPFLYVDGRLLTWQSVRLAERLEDGHLPIPSVVWEHERVRLVITAFAAGRPGASTLYARYRLENPGERTVRPDLFITIRPFQVVPPWQALNLVGGVTHIQDIRLEGSAVWINRQRAVIPLGTPDGFGAATFEEGSVTDFLATGHLPPRTRVADPFGFASAALHYRAEIPARGHATFDLAVPFHDPAAALADGLGAETDRAVVDGRFEETRRYWRTVLGRVEITLPPAARKLTDTMRSSLAYMLVNRDGVAIRPGPRNYARAWIRDGALTSAALLAMGFPQEVEAFLRWFASHQAADGRVPCCVDRRGADPVPEHDSAGAFIHTIAEYYRYTRDVGFLADLWPNVTRAVDYLERLRQQRMTEEFRSPEKAAFLGILPESISHEGYSAHPVHSYWDDFLALRGLKDAAELARVVGDDELAARYATLRDDFRAALYASIGHAMAQHHIDYIPGSVELGDFDPTSTSIAVMPGEEIGRLPEPALSRTFERYWAEAVKRRDEAAEWENYSPYELRNVGTLVRLGQRERALELLGDLLRDQRPRGWNQWAEISWRDPAAPRFIGDMPHGWVASGFIRSLRTLLAYERESDRALVLGAGIDPQWLQDEPGVVVKRLPTHYGVLNLSLRALGPDAVRVRISGDLTVPPGGLVVQSPLPRPLAAVRVGGEPLAAFAPDHAVIRTCPADVELRCLPGAR